MSRAGAWLEIQLVSQCNVSRTFEIKIEKLVYEGAGLGRHAGKVVFVPFSAQGDLLLVRPVEEKKNLIRASIVEILEPGPDRSAPRCPHFGVCGGCQWQHLKYPRQADAKRQILEEVFHHRFPETRTLRIVMIPSPEEYGYRSRARLQLRGYGAESKIGFYRSQSHVIEDVEECPLLRPSLNRGLREIREERWRGAGGPGLQQLELACSEEEGIWRAAEVESELDESISALISAEGSQGQEAILRRRIGEFVYALTPSAFFQANDFMIGELVSRVRNLARTPGQGAVLDLFCGVGLFTLPLARQSEKVTAVEDSPIALRFCLQNAHSAGLSNVQAVCAEVSAWMKAVGSVAPPAYSVILLDPPRSGAGAEVMKRIVEWVPERVVYVSCDPQTLCRDLALLPAREYRIDHVEGLDLFPQTYHFETIVRLRRR